jgi:methylmalonyl-CoA mutase C-terminal domain/subunit
MEEKIRVLLAKLGLDSHWRGAITIARALRDAGMEVIFIGNQSPEAIAAAAVQENVDVVGLSSLSGNHLALAPKVVELLYTHGLKDTLVVLGGTIPQIDISELREAGIQGIFPPGTPLTDIVDFIVGSHEEIIARRLGTGS